MRTPVQAHRPPSRRRKASIEIYFVLYLSAIILLLGTTPWQRHGGEEELEETVLQLLAPDFRVRAEKAALLYSFIPAGIRLDTAGANLRRDSLNLVTARGRFSSVRFAIVGIEDSSTGETLPPEAHASLLRRDERTALFQWRPSATDRNAVYRVTVVGTAVPLPPENLRPHIQERISEIMERRGAVSDTVTFTVNVFAINDQAALNRMVVLQTPTNRRDSAMMAALDPALGAPSLSADPLSSSMFGQPFELQPATPILPVPGGRTWRNRITMAGNGTFNDLSLNIDPPGISMVSLTPTVVELTGTAPLSGTTRVTLTGTRNSDGRPVSTNFVVRSARIAEPDITESMFVGQSYRLDFTAPELPSENIAVEVIENDQTIVSRTEGRSVITYQPSGPAKVRFVRYFGDQVMETSYAEVRPLPLPSVLKPSTQPGSNEAIVTTVCYGTVANRPNRVRLVVQEGNVQEPEELDSKYDEKNKMMTQNWRLRRRNPNEEFAFRAYALDQRGSGSGKSRMISFSDSFDD